MLEEAKSEKLKVETELLKIELDEKRKAINPVTEKVPLSLKQIWVGAISFLKIQATIKNILGLIAVCGGLVGFMKGLDEYKAYRGLRESENRVHYKNELVTLANNLDNDSAGLNITLITYFGKDAIPILLNRIEWRKTKTGIKDRNTIEYRAAIETIVKMNEAETDIIYNLVFINAEKNFKKAIEKNSKTLPENLLCEYLQILSTIKRDNRKIESLFNLISDVHKESKENLKKCVQ